jgi:hypothetical protein
MCGAVQFSAEAPSLFCCHCHCRYCRAAHGAAFVTWLGVRDQAFSITSGSDSLAWYESSQQGRRGFCKRCGTTLFYASELCPGEMHIARALIDGPVDREPEENTFTDQAVEWIVLDDHLPRHTSTHPSLSKYRKVTDR